MLDVTAQLRKLTQQVNIYINDSLPTFNKDYTSSEPVAKSIEDIRTATNAGIMVSENRDCFPDKTEVAETILTPSINAVNLNNLAITKVIKKQEAPQVISFLEKIITQLNKSIGFYHNQNPNNQKEVVALLNKLGEYIISRISRQAESHSNGIPEMIELEKTRNILVVQMIYLQNPLVPNSNHFRYLTSKIKLAQSLIDDLHKLLQKKKLSSSTYEDESSEYRV